VDLIRRDTLIEDLVEDLPESVGYLLGKGIQVIACGEPIWGSLEDVVKGKGYTDTQVDEIVAGLCALSAAAKRGHSGPSR
jgi:hypothetical protein